MCTCNDVNCLIGLAVDGLLDGPDKTALEQHTTECAACRRKLADLTAIRAELARPAAAPADLHEKIMGAVAAHEKQRKLRRMLKKAGSVAALLVICLMVAGGAALLDSGFMSADKAAGMEAAAPGAPMMTGAGMAASGSTTAGSASGYSGGSAPMADVSDVAPQEPAQEPVQESTATGGAMTVPTPSSHPSGPVANGAFRVLMAGEGIAFAGTYAFNLMVDGDPEEIKKVLGYREADEKAEGYVILQVPGDLDQVWDDLAKLGCTVTEDDRNGFTSQGPALEYGLVTVKLK